MIMKRFFSFFFIMTMCIVATFAQQKIDVENRVVLVAAQSFDEILVNGDVTVECRFKPELHRYVAYNTSEKTDKRIVCRNDSNRLIIEGNNDNDKVASRIVVFCNDSLKALIMNGTGNILVKEVPRLKRLHIIQNAQGAIKIDNLQAHFLSIVNNGSGQILARNVEARRLLTTNNGNGEIKLKTLKAFNGSFVSNGNSDMILNDLLIRKASFITNGSGNFVLSGKVNEATLTTNNSGNIDATNLSHKTALNINVNNTGTITTKQK